MPVPSVSAFLQTFFSMLCRLIPRYKSNTVWIDISLWLQLTIYDDNWVRDSTPCGIIVGQESVY